MKAKLIGAALAFLMLGTSASAVSNEDLQFGAVKLSIYDDLCAPLSPSYRETIRMVISTIGERERLRMFSEVRAAMVGVSTADFCAVLRPSVQYLEGNTH
jgi:hypothetical protein